jgi:hypothetical protein
VALPARNWSLILNLTHEQPFRDVCRSRRLFVDGAVLDGLPAEVLQISLLLVLDLLLPYMSGCVVCFVFALPFMGYILVFVFLSILATEKGCVLDVPLTSIMVSCSETIGGSCH